MYMAVNFNFKSKEIEEAYKEYIRAKNNLIRLLDNEQIEVKETTLNKNSAVPNGELFN